VGAVSVSVAACFAVVCTAGVLLQK
jgi:hypothetical protein